MFKSVTVLCLLLAVEGCSLSSSRPPPPARHDFGPGGNASTGLAHSWSAVSVTAPEWLQSDSIPYRLLYADPTLVRFYAFDRWLAPPAPLLSQRLALAGGGSGGRLAVHILQFEQVFDSKDTAHMVLVLQAMAQRPGTGETVDEKRFSLSVPAVEANAQGAVAAAAKLADEAVAALLAWYTTLPPL